MTDITGQDNTIMLSCPNEPYSNPPGNQAGHGLVSKLGIGSTCNDALSAALNW